MVVLGAGALLWLLRPDDPPAAKQPTPTEEFLARPTTFVHDLDKSEAAHDQVSSALKKTLLAGLRSGDRGKLESALADGFRAKFPAVDAGTPVADPRIELMRYEPAWKLPELDAAEFVARLQSYGADIAIVERASWRMFEFRLAPAGNSAFVGAHLQLAGTRKERGRSDFQATVFASVSRHGPVWQLDRLVLDEAQRGTSNFEPFRDISEASGFVWFRSEKTAELRDRIVDGRGVVTRGGLTVADFNNDDFWDVLVSEWHHDAVLFLNDGKGGFVRGSAPSDLPKLVPKHNGTMFLFVDLDGDGVEELVGSEPYEYERGLGKLPLYTRAGGSWQRVDDALRFNAPVGDRGFRFEGIVPGDVDGDGHVDLFFAGYNRWESKRADFHRLEAYDGADNLLFMGKGNLEFSEESDQRGITGTQYTYVGAFFDFDGDGDTDLFEGNDFGPNHLWLNEGDRFREDKAHVFGAGSSYTMGVTLADYDNRGAFSLYISNMYSHAAGRIVPIAADVSNNSRELAALVGYGNQLYEQDDGVWREVSAARRVNEADWAWACVFSDIDNDADKDLYVANGFNTNRDPEAPDY